MENPFIKGMTAGMIAGLLKNIPDEIFHLVPGWAPITLWDYAGVVALGRLPRGMGEHGYALILETLFCVFLGMVFVNIPFLASYGYFKLKGIIFGGLVWFFIRAAVLAYHIKILDEGFANSAVNLLASVLFGCVLTCMIKILDKKKTSNEV
jgi:hypothetical protein